MAGVDVSSSRGVQCTCCCAVLPAITILPCGRCSSSSTGAAQYSRCLLSTSTGESLTGCSGLLPTAVHCCYWIWTAAGAGAAAELGLAEGQQYSVSVQALLQGAARSCRCVVFGFYVAAGAAAAAAEDQQRQGSAHVRLQLAACTYHSVAFESYTAAGAAAAAGECARAAVPCCLQLLLAWYEALHGRGCTKRTIAGAGGGERGFFPACLEWVVVVADTDAGTVLQSRVLMCTGCFSGGGRVCLYQGIMSSVCPGS